MTRQRKDMTVRVGKTIFDVESGGVALTAFERDVLLATLKIPLGETRSYQWVAQQIGRPKAVRAVGQALRKNPYPIVIPCHRVIRADGSLGGYAGGTGERKAVLLALEKDICCSLSAGVKR